jgi:antitoxin component YwqK of YwqJK toxin-antitoxin module
MKFIISLLITFMIATSAFAQVTVENYSNGSKKSEGRLVNGQREGIWYEFNLKGLKVAEANYVNGVKEGKYRMAYEWQKAI